MRRTGKKYIADDMNVDLYMRQISRFPILDREVELKAANRYAKTKCPKAREEIINANLRFVVSVAHEFNGYGFRLMDLVQEGNMGLCVAIEKYEVSRKLRFISYAVWWIRAYMQRYILNNYSLVKIGTTTNQRRLFYKLRSTYAEVERLKLGSSDEEALEVARRLEVSVGEVVEIRARLDRDCSLDAFISSEDEGARYIDSLIDPRPLPDEQVVYTDAHARLTQCVTRAISTLTPREQHVMRCRMADEDRTLASIGLELGVSRERARQLEAKAKDKLRCSLFGAKRYIKAA